MMVPYQITGFRVGRLAYIKQEQERIEQQVKPDKEYVFHLSSFYLWINLKRLAGFPAFRTLRQEHAGKPLSER